MLGDLYKENNIIMDYDTPLSYFNGKMNKIEKQDLEKIDLC